MLVYRISQSVVSKCCPFLLTIFFNIITNWSSLLCFCRGYILARYSLFSMEKLQNFLFRQLTEILSISRVLNFHFSINYSCFLLNRLTKFVFSMKCCKLIFHRNYNCFNSWMRWKQSLNYAIQNHSTITH